MNQETILFIQKMFNSDISVTLKEVEVIARIKQDFAQWAQKQKPSPVE